MRRAAILLWRDTRASAAVETALVTPILLGLMFGAVDLGNYFMDEHVVLKAVRDSSRFAAHSTMANYTCASGSGSGSVASSLVTSIKNVARTGSTDGTAAARLGYWTDAATITVSVRCQSPTTYTGIYKGLSGGIPVVKVSATVPYQSLLTAVGLVGPAVNMVGFSESAVSGA